MRRDVSSNLTIAVSIVLLSGCLLTPKKTCKGIGIWTVGGPRYTMFVGDSIPFEAQVTEAIDDDSGNACSADDTRVIVTTDNADVAIVRSRWVVGMSPGIARITATNEKSGRAGYLDFTVRARATTP